MVCVVLDKLCKMVSALNCNHTELMKDRMVDSVSVFTRFAFDYNIQKQKRYVLILLSIHSCSGLPTCE